MAVRGLVALLLLSGFGLVPARSSSSLAESIARELSEKQEAPRGGLVWDLQARHGLVRERGLLRNGTLPIGGAVREVGYFYVRLGLGTPKREFSLIIDTGSTITYVPCFDCKHCGKHQDEPFNPTKSSTCKALTCGTPKCNCGSPSCQCMQENKCYYSRSYAERSSSAGFLLEDRFAFPDAAPGPVELVFGCEADETGEIFRQNADGIMGMGNNNNAFQSQLVEQKAIDNVFSLCFGFPSGGTMLLGDVFVPNAKEKMIYTALKPGRQVHYYTATMDSITIDGKKVGVPSSAYAVGYGAVLDSGTTFTYVPSDVFKSLSKMVDDYAVAKGLKRVPGLEPQFKDLCWDGAPKDWDKLETVFPKMYYDFAGGTSLHMVPYRYLFIIGEGKYCLGIFDNGNSGTLIGGISVRNVLVQYDRRNNRVGFLEADCNNLKANEKQAESPRALAAPKLSPPTPLAHSPSPPLARSPSPPNISPPPPPPPAKQQQNPPPPPPQQQQPAKEQQVQVKEENNAPQGRKEKPLRPKKMSASMAPLSGAQHHQPPSQQLQDYTDNPAPVAFSGGMSSLAIALILVVVVGVVAQLAYTYRATVFGTLRSVAGGAPSYRTVPMAEIEGARKAGQQEQSGQQPKV